MINKLAYIKQQYNRLHKHAYQNQLSPQDRLALMRMQQIQEANERRENRLLGAKLGIGDMARVRGKMGKDLLKNLLTNMLIGGALGGVAGGMAGHLSGDSDAIAPAAIAGLGAGAGLGGLATGAASMVGGLSGLDDESNGAALKKEIGEAMNNGRMSSYDIAKLKEHINRYAQNNITKDNDAQQYVF